MIASAFALLLSVTALALVHTAPSSSTVRDTPAASAAPVLKVRLAYSGLLAAAVAGLVPATGSAPLYLALMLFFAGVPMLGHQAIGLTPARRASRTLYRLWLFSAIFPPVVIGFGVGLLLEGRR